MQQQDINTLVELIHELGLPENYKSVLGKDTDQIIKAYIETHPGEAYITGNKYNEPELTDKARDELVAKIPTSEEPLEALKLGRQYEDRQLIDRALEKMIEIPRFEKVKGKLEQLYRAL